MKLFDQEMTEWNAAEQRTVARYLMNLALLHMEDARYEDNPTKANRHCRDAVADLANTLRYQLPRNFEDSVYDALRDVESEAGDL
jgi:hypothetical protein